MNAQEHRYERKWTAVIGRSLLSRQNCSREIPMLRGYAWRLQIGQQSCVSCNARHRVMRIRARIGRLEEALMLHSEPSEKLIVQIERIGSRMPLRTLTIELPRTPVGRNRGSQPRFSKW